MAELRCPGTPEELAELVGETTGTEQDDGSWVITCPAHTDRNPSLVVSLGERGRMKGRLLVHCRAGCSYHAVLGAFAAEGINIDPPRSRQTAKQRAATARLELDRALGGVLSPEQVQELAAADSKEDGDAGETDSEQEKDPTTKEQDSKEDSTATEKDTEEKAIAAEEEEAKEEKDTATEEKNAAKAANDRVQFQALERIWMAAGDIIGTPGERYLIEHRGLPDGGPWQTAVAGGFTLRFSAGDTLPTKDGVARQLGPMILARITMLNGKVCGFQVIPLGADGKKSGSFIVGKVPPGMAAIRLRSGVVPGGSLPALVLAEGLETGLSRLVPGLPGPVVLEVVCGALPAAVEKRVSAMARLLLRQGTGSPDYAQIWSRIELLVDRDKLADMTIPAQMLNAATRLTVAQLVAPAGLGGRNADLNDVLQTTGASGVCTVWLDGMLAALRPGECLMAPKGQETDLSSGLVKHTWRIPAGRTRLSVDANWYAWSATDKRWRREDDVQVLNDVQAVLDRSFEAGERSGVQRWSNTNASLRDRIVKVARDQASEPAIKHLSGTCYRLHPISGATELSNTILLQGGLAMDLHTREVWPIDQTTFGLSVIAADPKRLAEKPRLFERMLRAAFEPLDGFTPVDVDAQIMRVAELLGHALAGGRLNLQKLVLLLGASGAGKSLLVHVIQALLGTGYMPTSLDELGERFGLASLVGANVIMMSDIRDVGHSGRDPAVARGLSRLLKITGGDDVSVEVKFKPTYSTRLSQCVIGVANTMPHGLVDHTGALARRLETIDFAKLESNRSDDRTLVDEIIANELPGILGWALDGLDRLRSTGVFTTSAGISRYQNQHLAQVEPLRDLVHYVVRAPGSYLTRGESYAAYLCMTEDDGKRWSLSAPRFHPAFRRALEVAGMPVIERELHRASGQHRDRRVYCDLTWSAEMPEAWRRGTPRVRAVWQDLEDALAEQKPADPSSDLQS